MQSVGAIIEASEDWFNNGPDFLDTGVAVLLLIAAVIGAVTAIILFVKKVRRFFLKIDNFFDDFFGTEERPGVERKAGVMERLSSADLDRAEAKEQNAETRQAIDDLTQLKVNEKHTLDKIKTDVGTLKKRFDYEMTPNGGGSMKDTAVELTKKVEEHIEEAKSWRTEQNKFNTVIKARVEEITGQEVLDLSTESEEDKS